MFRALTTTPPGAGRRSSAAPSASIVPVLPSRCRAGGELGDRRVPPLAEPGREASPRVAVTSGATGGGMSMHPVDGDAP